MYPYPTEKRVRVMPKRDYVFKDVKPGDVRKVKEEYLIRVDGRDSEPNEPNLPCPARNAL
jgi:hypothetical protein